ncbi:GGDEF domain-containing protein (plasmid) [Deinococcus psychrotolerans]|uniref:GGDEF domain-containing protein n=1 Tax=Deinococcus psychrotolerans TaxID=2489213 RepID=A0A3G8YI40_9DEIO|nr:GGDEF domain-containing protein [Deinococcus psychrotolerans]AZI44922.1 GGDEF domain-containing protein [Deinococcus psychrotolerans]
MLPTDPTRTPAAQSAATSFTVDGLAPDHLRRRVYLGSTALGVGVLIGSWIINIQAPRPDPYISIGHPLLLLQCIWIMVWLLQGRALNVAERVVLIVNSLSILVQMLLALVAKDSQLIGLTSAAYWMLVAVSILVFLLFNNRQALLLCGGMYTLAVALPWSILLLRGAQLGSYGVLARVQLTCGAVLVLLSLLAWYKERFAAEQGQRHLLEQLAYTDPLTQLPNRHALYLEIDRLLTESGEGHHGCLILLDIDHFKRVNDIFGHTIGDQVLTEIASRLRREVGAQGCVGRWGGEEFLITLPRVSQDDGCALAERLRHSVAVPLLTPAGVVTASFGITPCFAGDDLQRLTARADRALYAAKESGRNRVVVVAADPEDQASPALTEFSLS